MLSPDITLSVNPANLIQFQSQQPLQSPPIGYLIGEFKRKGENPFGEGIHANERKEKK